MTWLRLALANLALSPLTSAVNVVLMGLGTASIVLLLLAGSQLSETLSRDARGIDLVLGAQGSPVQLVLAAVYHADVPPGNIRQQDTARWADDPRVQSAIPLSLGDSYRGFRIVGTTPAYAELYDAELAAGRLWSAPMEAVAGSAAAVAARLDVDSRFAGVHGLGDAGHVHDAQPYRVVGVLEPTGTVIDRLILTSLESVWDLHGHGETSAQDSHESEGHDHDHDHAAEHGHDHDHDAEHADEHDVGHEHDHEHDAEHGHEHDHQAGNGHEHEHDHEAEHEHEHEHEHEVEHAHDPAQPAGRDHEAHGHDKEAEHHDHEHGERDITAMLISYRSPLAAMTLPREVNASGTLQAASPAMEISRILQLVGIGLDGLRAFSWVLILTAALSVFAALYSSLRARRGDLAMLRCLGATRRELLLALLLEGLLLTAFGVALGFLVGHGAMELLGGWLESTRGLALTGWTWIPSETVLLFSLFGVGVLAAVIPAVQAYRTDVARTLAEG